MSGAIRIALVDAFTRVAGQGNRAGVVLSGGDLDAVTMQAVARAVGASETAFLLSDERATESHLRYFTPRAEIPFCGHATIAMMHYLAESRGLSARSRRRTIVCPAGSFEAELEAMAGGVRVWLTTPRYPWMDSPLDEHLLMELLGSTLAAREARLPIQRSGPKVFVPLRSRQELFALRPDWDRLTAVGREHGVLGVFAFTRDTVEAGSLAHARYFTPAQGVREDPVTGAANGPLAEYLVVHGELPLPLGDGVVRARSEQGDAIGKPGRVDLEVRASAGAVVGVRIAGVAVTVVVGDVRLASPSGLGRGFASLLTGVRW